MQAPPLWEFTTPASIAPLVTSSVLVKLLSSTEAWEQAKGRRIVITSPKLRAPVVRRAVSTLVGRRVQLLITAMFPIRVTPLK